MRGPGDRDIAVGMEVAGNGAEAPGSRKIGGRIPKWLNSVRWTAPSIGGERANLMIGHLVVWFIFAFGVHLFAEQLYNISFFGWPLNYYLAAQGSLIVFVVQLFVFNRQQNAIRRSVRRRRSQSPRQLGGPTHENAVGRRVLHAKPAEACTPFIPAASWHFFALMAVLEQFGLSAQAIGILFVAFTIGIYAFIGILSRTMAVEAYYVAGRSVPPVFNGMATRCGGWGSGGWGGGGGASFDTPWLAACSYRATPYMAFIVGWTGGYILVATIMAPYLRKFGCYTVRTSSVRSYGGKLDRFAGGRRAGRGVASLCDGHRSRPRVPSQHARS